MQQPTPIAIRRNADIQIHEQVFHQSWRPRYFGYLLGNNFKIQCTLSLVGKVFQSYLPTKKNIRELQNSSPLSQKESSNPRTSQNQMMVVATRNAKYQDQNHGTSLTYLKCPVPESTANIEWIEICINREIALKVWVPKTLIVGGVQKVCYLWKKKKRMKLKNPLIVMKRDTTIVTVVNLIWILQLETTKEDNPNVTNLVKTQQIKS